VAVLSPSLFNGGNGGAVAAGFFPGRPDISPSSLRTWSSSGKVWELSWVPSHPLAPAKSMLSVVTSLRRRESCTGRSCGCGRTVKHGEGEGGDGTARGRGQLVLVCLSSLAPGWAMAGSARRARTRESWRKDRANTGSHSSVSGGGLPVGPSCQRKREREGLPLRLAGLWAWCRPTRGGEQVGEKVGRAHGPKGKGEGE
jgi:hypothetical protein